MTDILLNKLWRDIPIGRTNAVTYDYLCALWNCNKRTARAMLHELSLYDNGDNYILIRSGGCKGFYKTDDETEIKAYKKECLNKGKSIFAPVKKINRVLNANTEQFSIINNLRVIRECRGFSQSQVCDIMKRFQKSFDKSLLSRMENNICLPTYFQLSELALIYNCEPSELLDVDLYYPSITTVENDVATCEKEG